MTVYSIFIHTGKGEGGGELTRERGSGKREEAEGWRGAGFVERGSGKREEAHGRRGQG
jgi:hypothetical protein